MQCNNSYAIDYDAYPPYIEKDLHWLEVDYNNHNNNSNNNNHSGGDHCLFRRREPSMIVFSIYAFVVPSLSLFGLCANFINAIVFMRPKMTPSAFTYLAALSWLDCLSCLFITFTAFSRSIFFYSNFWLAYDLKWQTPLFGITTGAANLILACVSLDRLVYLWRGIPNGTPRLCRRVVARRMIIVVICISCAVNFPYFFVFVVHKDGTFATTDFYYSNFYKIHNWFSFILLAILPAIFLLIGNAAILIAFRRWTKQSKKCQKHCGGGGGGSGGGGGGVDGGGGGSRNEKTNRNGNGSGNGNGKVTQKRYQHQMKLTITILIVITLYLIGELPAHLTSRKSALNLLYSGDVNKVDFKLMERLETICITLNAVQLSMNIMVYALINPSFMPEFFVCLRGASDACFRFFCFTGVYRYCRQRFQRHNRIRNSQNVLEKDCKDESSWSNGDGDGFGDDDNDNDEAAPPYNVGICATKREQHRERQKNAENQMRERSKSWGNFTFDNHGMDLKSLDENSNSTVSTPKRHSMPPIFVERNVQ